LRTWLACTAAAHVLRRRQICQIMIWFKDPKLSIFMIQTFIYGTPDHLILDSAPNIGPLISRWELDKFKNCRNKSYRTSKILTLLCQQFSNLLISQRDMSGPRLETLSNNRWSGGIYKAFSLLLTRNTWFSSLALSLSLLLPLDCLFHLKLPLLFKIS
jgi:hypothetical protein